MSNDLGTHIGYCISLGKPHYLFCQEIEIKHINEKFLEHSDDTRENKIKKERQLFSKLFSSSDPVITEEQRQVVNYYWGHTFQKRK
jgi:fructose-1-phosphate kinase PfkB-like protein